MNDALALALQRCLPKHLLTRAAGAFARRPCGWLSTAAIRAFIRHYRVDMSEAAQPDPAAYATFNDFFTRALRDGARPLAQAERLCPVDGAISQCGAIADGQILQAKGQHYTAAELLGGDAALAARFAHGSFATLYLSPRDYHRIHLPCAATLREMIFVPGALYSVNPATARALPGLFARNERAVCVFDTAEGAMALVLVGATIVGSIRTVWAGTLNARRDGQMHKWRYDGDDALSFPQGAEIGSFALGSTVIALFERPAPFPADWLPARSVRMGEAMCKTVTTTPDTEPDFPRTSTPS